MNTTIFSKIEHTIIMKITGVILAAGMSSRMGQNKLLLPYNNHTIIEEVALQLSGSKVDNILIVTGFEKNLIERAVKNAEKLRPVHNENYKLGRAESIKCAVRYVDQDADALLFMVGDKPTVSSGLINKAIYKFKKTKPKLLYTQTPSGRGHPIIFSNTLLPELLLLAGDEVGNGLIAKYKDETVILEDSEIQVDIDTLNDYNLLLK